MGVSGKLEGAIGMSVATLFVLTVSSVSTTAKAAIRSLVMLLSPPARKRSRSMPWLLARTIRLDQVPEEWLDWISWIPRTSGSPC